MSKKAKEKQERYMGKVVGISLGNLSQAMETIVVGQLTYYLTNSIYIAAATVGLILMCARFFDGFTDFLAGFLIDRTKSRWGKGRPYALVSIPMWIGVVLLFSTPNISKGLQIAYVFIVYVLIEAVGRTLVLSAQTIHLKRAFRSKQQVIATTGAAVVGAFGSIVGSVVMPVLISIFEHQEKGWTIIALIYAIPCGIMGLLQFLLVKEFPNEDLLEGDNQVKVPAKEALKALLHNKYILIYGAAYLVYAISQGMATAGTYYFTYIIGDLSKMSIVNAFAITAVIPLFFLPFMKNHIGMTKSVKIGLVVAIIAGVLRFFFPTNVFMIGLLGGISAMGILPLSGFMGLVAIDCMKYTLWRDNLPVEAVISSVSGIASKVGIGVGSAMIGLMMALSGFNGANAVQSASSLNMISFLYLVLPVIIYVVMLIILMFYRLDAQLPQIEKELEERANRGRE